MDLFNDFFLLITLYHMMCFTAFVGEPSTRRYIGASLISVTNANVILNFGILIRLAMRPAWLDLRRWYYKDQIMLKKHLKRSKKYGTN